MNQEADGPVALHETEGSRRLAGAGASSWRAPAGCSCGSPERQRPEAAPGSAVVSVETGRRPVSVAFGLPVAAARVNFVEFNAKVPVLGHSVILPKYGTALLGAILRERGCTVTIFLEGVSDLDLERIVACDVLCLPVYFPIVNKVRDLVHHARRRRPGLPVVLGGPQVCLYPGTVQTMADVLVHGEGDEVLPLVVDALRAGVPLDAIPGISFWRQGRLVRTPDPPPPPIPTVAPDLGLVEGLTAATRQYRRYVINTLQTSRGCRFGCRFCPTGKLFGHSYRNRDLDAIIADIKARLRFGRLFFVVDNSFLSSRARTVELLERLIAEDLGVAFFVFERHEIGRDPELLRLMVRAGVRCIIVGIESLDDRSLEFYDKRQSGAEVATSVAAIQAAGLHVIGTFVLGGDHDTPARATQIVEFVRRTGISLNLFVMHDVEHDDPAQMMIPLHRRFATWYRRTDPTDTSHFDYLTGNFVTYFPKRMKPSTLQQCMGRVLRECLSYGDILRRAWATNVFAATFGVGHAWSLRALGDTIAREVDRHYLAHLRRLEDGLYDDHEELIEERLVDLRGLPLPRPLPELHASHSYRYLMPLITLPGLTRMAWRRWTAGAGRGTGG